jgi:S1-C subfamily serine protease
MAIELRVLSGARAGQSEAFDKPVIAIGRHPSCDLQLNPRRDLDVSAHHAELRYADGRYVIADTQSKNGTFVNGHRLAAGAAHPLAEGDVIGLGASGPTVAFHILAAGLGAGAGAATGEAATTGPRRATSERVAVAVAEQTRGLKLALLGAVLVFGGLGASLYWMGHREARASDARLAQLMSSYEQSSKALQARVETTNDTLLIAALQREKDSLVRAARTARGSDAVVVQQALQQHQSATRAITGIDLEAVQRANNAAVALVHTKIGDQSCEATGFAAAPDGLLITNRHVVENDGARASSVQVKFADTQQWHTAHVVALPVSVDVDLALLQVDDAAHVAPVRGFADPPPVGSPIASLGFPLGSELPMEGGAATTTLTIGIVSKTVSDLLQIDSYASHGSSGSPVFDAEGRVVGVVYGGPKEAAGRIVFAVPASGVQELLKGKN